MPSNSLQSVASAGRRTRSKTIRRMMNTLGVRCCATCHASAYVAQIGSKRRSQQSFPGQWKSALYHFVMDAQNEWCPTWIVRNYEALNDVIQGLPALSSTPLVVPDDVEQQSSESLENIRKLPHAELFKSKFLFEECGEPGPIEDACGYEQAAIEDSWSKAERPAWQLHSALGPNIKPTQLSMRVAPLQEIVNPLHYDYATNVFEVQPHAVNAFWEQVARTSSRYDDPSLHRELLRDDDQQLFVDLMLRHVKAVISFTLHTGPWVPPLRVLLLGGPGTGKTKTLQTALQEIYRLLDAAGLPVDFIRCAAPTGCAAFNMKFNATTIHRLISLFPHQAWSELSDERLAHLQAYLASTRFLVIDEFSMLGRQFMGKVDSRCCQAKACCTAAWVACLVRWWVTRHKSKRSMINNATIEPRTKKQFVAAALRMCNFPTAAWMCMRNSTQWSSFQKCTGCSSTRKPTHQKSKSSTTRARAFCAFCMRCAMLLSLMTITFGCAG